MNSLSLLVILALVAIPALEARVAPHIIGGRNARVGAWPWQGSLQRRGFATLEQETFDSHTCGCALVSSTWLVTAAHCVGAGPGGLFVVLGLHRRGDRNTGAPRSYSINSIISHPYWNRRTLNNDIAMIRLDYPAQQNRYVRTVRMASSFDNFDGQRCVITGWGVTTTGGGRLATVLQQADVRVYSVGECQRYWSNTGASHICVNEPNRRGSCNGDSGGPLVCPSRSGYILAGVTSFGQRGCYTNTPSVYSRISYFRGWIRRVSGL